MSFLAGRATFLRFRVWGHQLGPFSETHLGSLAAFAAGRQKIASADGIETGWTAGDSILDTAFTLEKNLIADALCFEFRVDTDKPPADLLKAYYQVELAALAANNPSGIPSQKQKREARECAKERLEHEAKDGRFRKRKCVPVLWDSATGEVLYGATSLTHVDRMTSLFRQTFGVDLEAITAGKMAAFINETIPNTTLVVGMDDDGLSPSPFTPDSATDGVAWIPDDTSRDFLGNEFLLWLWFISDGESDSIKLSDNTEATFMFARTLALECPRGQTGHDKIGGDGPTRLPEARRAIQAGKLPRKAGFTIVRQSTQYELTLHAETLAIGSMKFPPPEDGSPRAKLEERIGQLRHVRETLDLMYGAYCRVRLGGHWPDMLARMQRWLAKEDRRAA